MMMWQQIKARGAQPATKDDIWLWMFVVPVVSFFVGFALLIGVLIP